MARNRNIKVTLNDEEYAFLNWLADRDGLTVTEELQNLFYHHFSEEMNLYNDERLMEENKKR